MSNLSRKKREAQQYTVPHADITSGYLGKPYNKRLSGKRPLQEGRNSKYLLAGTVSLITFIVYLPCLLNEFIRWDDHGYVYENSHIRSLNLSFYKWAFLDFAMGNWHPITWISHAIDYSIWGLDPLGHHLTSIILHAINTFLVVLLSVRLLASWQADKLTGGQADKPASSHISQFTIYDPRFALIAAGVAGLLFGLHPLHVESVAWVSERKDLLCAMFYLLSLLQYISYRSDKTYKTYLFSLFFFVLALLSKPMAVSLPLVLLILDWYPFRAIQSVKTLGPAFIEKLPFIALSLVSSVLTILAQKAGDAIQSLEALPLASRLIVAAKSLAAYLVKMILPLNLVPYYPYPTNISLFSLEYIIPIVAVTAIMATCVVVMKHQKLWISVWGYYVITLMPVLGIVQVGAQSMADRYMYLPGISLFLIAGSVISWGWIKLRTFKKNLFLQLSYISIAILIFISMAYLTLGQIKVWRNTLTFWTYVIDKEPLEVPLAYKNRGDALCRAGQLDKALADYDRAIELAPRYYLAYISRGIVLAQEEHLDKAFTDYSRAIELNPELETAYYNIACLFSRQNHVEEACKWLKEGIDKGYKNWDHIKTDADLNNIRNASCYREIMAGK